MEWDSCLAAGDVATINCIFPLFQNILNFSLGFAGFVALFFIIFGGFKLITSGGDAKKVGAARQTITFAIAGLVLVFVSFFIINLISYMTSAGCIKTFGFNSCETRGSGPIPLSPPPTRWGCFYKEGVIDPPACYEEAPHNNPRIPLRWYDSAGSCNAGCKSLPR